MTAEQFFGYLVRTHTNEHELHLNFKWDNIVSGVTATSLHMNGNEEIEFKVEVGDFYSLSIYREIERWLVANAKCYNQKNETYHFICDALVKNELVERRHYVLNGRTLTYS